MIKDISIISVLFQTIFKSPNISSSKDAINIFFKQVNFHFHNKYTFKK